MRDAIARAHRIDHEEPRVVGVRRRSGKLAQRTQCRPRRQRQRRVVREPVARGVIDRHQRSRHPHQRIVDARRIGRIHRQPHGAVAQRRRRMHETIE
jgi:hypothetical protein